MINKEHLPYLVGNRVFSGSRSFPNSGATSDILGYRERDRRYAARRAAVLRRLKAQNAGNYGSADVRRTV